jgi:cell division protein FtsW
MSFSNWFGTNDAGGTRRVDHVLVASIILLTGWGLVTLYSASYSYAERFFSGGLYFFKRQAIYAGCGFLLMLFFARINLELFRKLIPLMVIATLILCFLPLVPGLQYEKNGAPRWIRIGTDPNNPKLPRFTIQPSEFIKIALPFYLAHIFSKKGDGLNNFSRGILPPAIVIAFFVGVVCLQNNFSTAVFIAVNAVAMFFLAGVKKRWFVGAIVMFTPIAALMVLTETHRLVRMQSFFRPGEADIRGAGYQIFTSLRAINSGGFWGKGLGHGTWKVAGIPEVHTDFIFSAFSEEMGYLGIILVIVLFAVFAYRGYLAALSNGNRFERLLGFGLVNMIVSQALVNLGVTCGALPTTGLPLPFFSAGGTYLGIVLVAAGFIVNVSRKHRAPGFAAGRA